MCNWRRRASIGLFHATITDSLYSRQGAYRVTLLSDPFDTRPGLYHMQPDQWHTNLQSGARLTWDEVAGATGYDVYLGTSLTQALPAVQMNFQNTEFDLGLLPLGQLFYWQVKPVGVPLVSEGTPKWFIMDLLHNEPVVMINEVLADAIGNDTTGRLEFIEILHE